MAPAPRRQSQFDAPDRWLGRVIASRYRMEARLGAGAAGTVYRAIDSSQDRDVAVKIVEARDPVDGEAFRRRGVALMRLDHPGIPRLLDFGCDEDGVSFFAMERAEGEPLDAVLRHKRRFEPAGAVEIALQLARAIEHVHAAGLVHRDLKPSNVLLSRRPDGSPRVVLLDFGSAAAPGEGGAEGLQGSPAYAAPEQAIGGAADPRDDVYSLGVIVYELLIGRPPFEDGSAIGAVLRHLHEPPKPLRMLEGSIPRRLEAATSRALAKSRDGRFQSMAEWIDALESVRVELAATESPDRSAAAWLNEAWTRFARLVGF